MLRKLFLPNKKNNHHPYAIRPLGLVVAFGLLLLVNTTYNIVSAKQFQVLGYATNINVSDLNSLSNSERTSRGLKAYSLNSKLNTAAYNIAKDMFAKNYWSHYDPSGKPHWHFITEAGYAYSYAGENLAKDFNSSNGVVSAWMNSSTHRANILSKTYKDAGYAAVNGKLSGSKTTLVVGLYAKAYSSTTTTTTQSSSNSSAETKTVTQTTTPVTETKKTSTAKKSKKKKTTPVAAAAKPAVKLLEPEVKGLSFKVTPASLYSTLNWSQKASLFILLTLLLVNLMKHTLVWRANKRGLRHIWLRSHPLAQSGMLIIIFLALAFSGAGVVK